jgi:hypothetical protein
MFACQDKMLLDLPNLMRIAKVIVADKTARLDMEMYSALAAGCIHSNHLLELKQPLALAK